MANKLPALSPEQVVALQDTLLANADRLLSSSLAVLDLGHAGLAGSLAVLGLEESGKAIAIHQRRVDIAHEPEGEPFVNPALSKMWGDHKAKLKLVHDFLVAEEYWFDDKPADPGLNLQLLGEIEEWASRHNALKQRGFYVDVDDKGDVIDPIAAPNDDSLRSVITQVHQIGWQLRLGEHIVAKQQKMMSAEIPVASADALAETIEQLNSVEGLDPSTMESILDGMRSGRPSVELRNDRYRYTLPEPDANPFANFGKPGYEAETRELLRLAEDAGFLEQSGLDEKS